MKNIHALNYKELSTKFTEKLNSVTLEETAERLYQKALEDNLELTFHDGVKLGAKWQQKQDKNKYSEEEVWSIIRMVAGFKDSNKTDTEISNYFEQNKKK